MAAIADRLLFVDVETTGLHSSDRVVSLGAVELDLQSLQSGHFDVRGTYLIFDPGRKSHPQAQAVHGYSDWILRHQEPFEAYAEELNTLFSSCERVVAHNASFDQRFVSNEFQLAGTRLNCGEFFCTMQAFRSRIGGRAGLDAVMARMGVGTRGKRHGAFEDAWRAMMVYLWLHNLPVPSLDIMPDQPPSNWRDPPPEPFPLPRRNRKKRISESPEDARRPPDSVEIGLSPKELAPSHRDVLVRELRPIAVVLMWIARAEGSVEESNISVLRGMIAWEADRRGFRGPANFDLELATDLAEMHPTTEMLDVAARAIIRDEALRDRLTELIRAIVLADGRTTETERRAIAQVTAAFEKARSALLSAPKIAR